MIYLIMCDTIILLRKIFFPHPKRVDSFTALFHISLTTLHKINYWWIYNSFKGPSV